MRAIKNLNNNVALCVDGKNREVIAFGKGIGFNKVPNDIPLSRIDRTFYNVSPTFVSVIPEIDETINRTSTGWKTERMSRADLAILRLAVFEMLRDDNIPTGVAINEAVLLARKFGGDDSSSFVNGILAKMERLRSKA